MTTEQLEILHDLIEALMDCAPIEIVRTALSDKFGEDDLPDLQEAIHDLADETGNDPLLDVAEIY